MRFAEYPKADRRQYMLSKPYNQGCMSLDQKLGELVAMIRFSAFSTLIHQKQ
jgi:hypothetical protein